MVPRSAELVRGLWSSTGLAVNFTTNGTRLTGELLDAMLDASLIRCHEHFEGRLHLKVDVCWSSRLPRAPQLFFDEDCRAGSIFLSVTSDKRVLSCSFASRAKQGIELTSLDELPAIEARLEADGAPRRRCPGLRSQRRLRHTKAPRSGRRRLPQIVEVR